MHPSARAARSAISTWPSVGCTVNAGHEPPLRLRGGRVETIELRAEPPFGMFRDDPYRVQVLPLQAGDRLMFLRDGMLERNAADVDVRTLVIEGAQMHPREAVQHVVLALLEAADGASGTTRPRCASTGTAARRARSVGRPEIGWHR